MGATLRILDDAPILIVTHQGYLDLQAVETSTALVARALAESDVPLYGIIDLRAATTDFSEMLRILYHQSRGASATLSAERNRVVIVGSHPLIRMFRKLLQRELFGGLFVPVFSTLEEALAVLHGRIAADAQAKSHSVSKP